MLISPSTVAALINTSKSRENHHDPASSVASSCRSHVQGRPLDDEPALVPASTDSVCAAFWPHFEYVRRLVNQGGPEPSDYETLNHCWSSIAALRREGVVSWDDFECMYRRLGDAFWSRKTMNGFVNLKPYGYAGDFEIIERIYRQWISPEPHLAKWDRFFHALHAPRAVRNRKSYFQNILKNRERSQQHHPFKVLNLGCGPARETFEYLCTHEGNGIAFECVDQDPAALAYAASLNRDFLHCIRFHRANVLRFRSEAKYDLIWSAGLFDYLPDRLFAIVLKQILRLAKKDGQIIIGNFSPANPTRDYMECGNWFLHHRTAEELQTLAEGCGVSAGRITIGQEPEGVNLFLHVRCN